MPSPVIGIPVSRSDRDTLDYVVRQAYCTALALAGGAPVLIPPLQENLLRSAYARLDGLLLAGGGDVSNTYYGNPSSERLTYLDPVRDELELTLTRWALDDGIPLLGICRGIQMLNVAGGGTLVQDISNQWPDSLNHSADRKLPRSHIQHTIQVQGASRLAAVLFREEQPVQANPELALRMCGVNSYHHQAVDQLAPSFVATAHAPDGVIEAIEFPSSPRFVVGVQWHPECMVPGNAVMERLFHGFVDACRR